MKTPANRFHPMQTPRCWRAAAGRLMAVSGLALALWGGVPAARAATVAPPERMTYQGFLVDANGVPLATNAPANFPVTFRIFNVPTGGTALWGESQVVTVDKGQFSVLLGEGTPVGTPIPLSNVFTNASDGLYIGLSVTINSTVHEILPRLQLVTSAYSYMATSAGKLVNPANGTTYVSFNNGAQVTGNLNVTGTIAGNGSLLTNLNLNSYQLNAANLTGSLSDSRLSANVALRTTGNNFNGGDQTITGTGNFLGVGTTLPNYPISLGTNWSSTKLAIYDASASSAYGIGIQSNQFRLHLDGATSGRFSFLSDADGTEMFTVSHRGDSPVPVRVGIGVANPTRPLQFPDTTGDKISLWGSGGDHFGIGVGPALLQIHSDASHSDIGFGVGSSEQFQEVVRINMANRRLGIGTRNPVAPLHVEGTAQLGANSYFLYSYTAGGQSAGFVNQNPNFSIYASGSIRAGVGTYLVGSDARIKNVVGRTDSRTDLETLRRLQVTDYTLVDQVMGGGRKEKRLIAQEVEQAYPLAVSQAVEVVPDIYAKATAKAGWIPLKKALEPALRAGDKLRLITEGTTALHEVTEVTAEGFRVKEAVDGPVFVYGREVDDFRSVDYDAIAMLNVSATQELARRLERLEAREARLASLEKAAARVTELESELSALKALVIRLAGPDGGKGAATTAAATPVDQATASATGLIVH